MQPRNTQIFSIDKSFDFCYGHRVWTQKLDSKLTSGNSTCLACRHIHGHQGRVKIFMRSSDVDDTGMVTDFKHLGFMKDFIDDVLDHKFIMDINDPLFSHEVPKPFNEWVVPHPNDIARTHNIKCISPELLDGGPLKQEIAEKFEGMVFVPFVPTSENLTKFLLDVARSVMGTMRSSKRSNSDSLGYSVADHVFEVYAAEFWETPKSHCRFEYPSVLNHR